MLNKKKLLTGWEAITDEFLRLYPDAEQKNYATKLSWEMGGNDPLPEITAFDDKENNCWHFVTYGLTELYEKESEDKKTSGYGMEFTFRLKKGCYIDEEQEIINICCILQSLARLTFENGEVFEPYEYVYTGQTNGIDNGQKSKITGFITIPDIKAQPLKTAFGDMEFVQFIGVTDSELKAIINEKITVRQLYEKLGSDLTDYKRKPVI